MTENLNIPMSSVYHMKKKTQLNSSYRIPVASLLSVLQLKWRGEKITDDESLSDIVMAIIDSLSNYEF